MEMLLIWSGWEVKWWKKLKERNAYHLYQTSASLAPPIYKSEVSGASFIMKKP